MIYFVSFLVLLLIVSTFAIMYFVIKSYFWLIDRVKYKRALSCAYFLLALSSLYLFLLFTGMAVFA